MTMTTTHIDTNDFSDILDLVIERVEQWGEELHESGWRGNVGLLIEGETGWSEWISPLIGGGFDLQRSVGDHEPIQYDPECEYRHGTDDDSYPVNQINKLLMEYTGDRPYWYNLILRIHPEDGVRLSVIG